MSESASASGEKRDFKDNKSSNLQAYKSLAPIICWLFLPTLTQ